MQPDAQQPNDTPAVGAGLLPGQAECRRLSAAFGDPHHPLVLAARRARVAAVVELRRRRERLS